MIADEFVEKIWAPGELAGLSKALFGDEKFSDDPGQSEGDDTEINEQLERREIAGFSAHADDAVIEYCAGARELQINKSAFIGRRYECRKVSGAKIGVDDHGRHIAGEIMSVDFVDSRWLFTLSAGIDAVYEKSPGRFGGFERTIDGIAIDDFIAGNSRQRR